MRFKYFTGTKCVKFIALLAATVFISGGIHSGFILEQMFLGSPPQMKQAFAGPALSNKVYALLSVLRICKKKSLHYTPFYFIPTLDS